MMKRRFRGTIPKNNPYGLTRPEFTPAYLFEKKKSAGPTDIASIVSARDGKTRIIVRQWLLEVSVGRPVTRGTR